MMDKECKILLVVPVVKNYKKYIYRGRHAITDDAPQKFGTASTEG